MPVILAADVGGTNSRVALIRHGRLLGTPMRFRNDGYAGFEDVAAEYLSQIGADAPDAVCVAAAGPVSGGAARFTNRDWTVEGGALARALGAKMGLVLNDLAAQGLGLHRLSEAGARLYLPAASEGPSNGQALVAGFGTGMNLCAVRRLEGGRIVHLEAEYGHCATSSGVMAEAPEGAAADTPEHWFSGRGIARLDGALHGRALKPEEIAAAAQSEEPEALATLERFARMAGALCRDLALQYMPRDGIYLSGGAARAAMDPRFADSFAAVYRAHPRFPEIPGSIPVRIVEDDDAALMGCAAAMEQAFRAAEA